MANSNVDSISRDSLFSKLPLFSSFAQNGNEDSSKTNTPFWRRSRKAPGTVKQVQVKNGFLPRLENIPNSRKSIDGRVSPVNFENELRSDCQENLSEVHPLEMSKQELSNGPTTNFEESYNEEISRLAKFQQILSSANVDIAALKKLSWNGVPQEVRPITWKILMGYLPTNNERREITLKRKRAEYYDCVEQYFHSDGEVDRTEQEQEMFRQISIDMPRTLPSVPIFQQDNIQQAILRILYIWAVRHPASGYVQGINDLVCPFFGVFLTEYYEGNNVEGMDSSTISPSVIGEVEADSYWCVSKLLDGIQDHYTFSQPGIQRTIFKMRELVMRIDAPLANHLEKQDAQFIQFAFRWVNCLLLREFSLSLVIRLWDTYMSDESGRGFSLFHVYVCTALLVSFSKDLLQLEFQDIMLFLQHLPTQEWTNDNIGLLASQAFYWMSV